MTDTNTYKLSSGRDAIIVTDANGNENIYLPTTLTKSVANLTAQQKRDSDRIQQQIDLQNNLINQYNTLVAQPVV